RADRLLADDEGAGDLTVGVSGGDETEDLVLASGQPGDGRRFFTGGGSGAGGGQGDPGTRGEGLDLLKERGGAQFGGHVVSPPQVGRAGRPVAAPGQAGFGGPPAGVGLVPGQA